MTRCMNVDEVIEVCEERGEWSVIGNDEGDK